MTTSFDTELEGARELVVAQRRELAEMFGFESRNKYEVRLDSGRALAFAAEQQKGFTGFLARQFLGHWRTFEIRVFGVDREPVLVAHHPFRWFFSRLEVTDAQGRRIGALQRRFALLHKRFDLEDAEGNPIALVSSPLWRPWTFAFERDFRDIAAVRKRWSGALTEIFTDADTFKVELHPGPLTLDERKLLLAAAIFIDLEFFEEKAGE